MPFKPFAAFVALAAVVCVSAATAVIRRGDLVTCNFVLTPTAAVDPSNLVAEFNFVIGHSLAVETGDFIESKEPGSSYTLNNDGTFNVIDTFGADGDTAAQTAAIVEGWVGQTKGGIVANWLVNSVNCA